MKKSILMLLAISAVELNAQNKVDVDGDLNVTGAISGTGATISGSSPVRLATTATTVLDLRANNPLIELRDNNGTYLAFAQYFGTDFYLANRQAGRMLFRTNNLNRMIIDADGNVGIGLILPASTLTVNGSENNGALAGLEVRSGAQKIIMDGNEMDCVTGGLHFNNNSLNDILMRTTTRRAEVTMNHDNGSGAGNGVTIEHTGSNNVYWTWYATNGDGNLELYYKGNFRGEFSSGSGAWTQASDRRLKENIQPLTNVLGRVAQFKPSVYNFKDDQQKAKQIGLLAQDISLLFPEIVTKGGIGDSDQEVYTLDYASLTVIALAAIQELAAMQQSNPGDPLVLENQKLKDQVKTLENRLARLETMLESNVAANNKLAN